MAKFYDVNRDTTTNANGEILYRVMTTLVSAGWVVKASGDGLSAYDATGSTAITGPGSGANGMNNTKAWFRIQDPGARREFIFQRGSAATSGRAKYSALDNFTGGSPSATVTPSATDEQVVTGGGTDATPTYSTIWGTAGNYKAHIIAQSTVEGDVYGFWMFTTNNGTFTTAGGTIFCEPMASGSFSSSDADACVVGCPTNTNSSFAGASSTVFGWYKMNLSGEAFVSYHHCAPASMQASTFQFGTAFAGTNPYDGDTNAVAAGFSRNTALSSPGWKGFGKYLKYKGAANVYPDTINLATDAYVFLDACLIPWPESITPG